MTEMIAGMNEVLSLEAHSAGVSRRRFTRAEYERAGELGLFHPDERLELIAGEVVRKMTPQKSPHATGIQALNEALRSAFAVGFNVRVQLPLVVSDESEPEPDLCVVEGSYRDYRHEHPRTALLVVEVADSTLAYDRLKAGLYASASVPEYWILSVKDGSLEVFREPSPAEGQPFGHAYTRRSILKRGETVTPLGATASLRIEDLLP